MQAPGDGHSGPSNSPAITLTARLLQRLIGSIRRECLDNVVILGERHLRRVLLSYGHYCNGTRTHLLFTKGSSVRRPVRTVGSIQPIPLPGGPRTNTLVFDLRWPPAKTPVQLTGLYLSRSKLLLRTPVHCSPDSLHLSSRRHHVGNIAYRQTGRVEHLCVKIAARPPSRQCS